jgi:hypothetical protein
MCHVFHRLFYKLQQITHLKDHKKHCTPLSTASEIWPMQHRMEYARHRTCKSILYNTHFENVVLLVELLWEHSHNLWVHIHRDQNITADSFNFHYQLCRLKKLMTYNNENWNPAVSLKHTHHIFSHNLKNVIKNKISGISKFSSNLVIIYC